jgi:DNA-binding NtrC family response regulator
VLVVAGSLRRLAEVRAALGLAMPDVRVESVDTVVEALLRLTRKPAQLLVLDLAVDDAFAPAVVRHLARVAPVTEVLVFDDRARTVPGHQRVQAWDELDSVLTRWHASSRRTPTGPHGAEEEASPS